MKTLNILAVGDPAVDIYVSQETNIIKNYEDKYNIKINFDIVPWVNYYDRLMESFENYTYDIVMVAGHLWLNDFVEKGYLREISISKTTEYDFEDFLENIRKELSFKGKNYLLPSFCDGHILMYRKSQVDEPIKALLNLKDILPIIKRNQTSDKNTFVLKAHPSEILLDFLPYLRTLNSGFIDPKGFPLFFTPESVEALDYYKELKEYCSSDVENFGNEEVLNEIQKNKCKLGVSWSGQLGQIMNDDCLDKEDIEFVNIENSWNVSWSFGLNKFTDKVDEASKFLHYLTSKEIDKQVGAHCGNPTRTSSFEDGFDKYPWYKAVHNMINTSKPLPSVDNLGDAMGITASYLTEAFTGKKTSTEALRQALVDIRNKK